jgi:two-component system, NtrC family, response regulator AtoC
MNEVLRVLLNGGDEEDALRRSFEDAAQGFNAERALFLLVHEQPQAPLQRVCVLGLTEQQIRACERGDSVTGVSSSVIRSVLRTRQPRVVENPLFMKEVDQTPALVGQNYSVLCAPVLDPVREVVLAVLYFQNGRPDPDQAYGQGDAEWLQGYASALGQAFAFHFQRERRERELKELLAAGDRPPNAPELIGDSAHMQALRRELHCTYIPAAGAPDPDPLLLLGERGTGKDLVARYLHAYSIRRDRPFVAVNCAEITDELAAARFFGHRRGSFTGAVGDALGFFRAAQGGVLFLDEVAELSPKAQGTLLRVLENRTIVAVGDTREARVDVQVVLATNRDPEQLVAEGSLKPDLYDRFRTQVLRLQPVRERPWDIPALVRHFIAHHERRTKKKTMGVAPDAMRALVAHAWPGNVRELDRVCSLLITHAEPNARIDRSILVRCYPDVLGAAPSPKVGVALWEDMPMREAVRAFERELILSRLERHNWNVRAVRESLRLPKTTFHRYALELGLRGPDYHPEGPEVGRP